ncbi:MAG: PDZ domain-containing protein [Armatimonadota bacterium]
MRPENPELARLLSERVVPVRLTSLKGVDLSLFDFDYDQTLMALLVSPQGSIGFRWTARDDEPGAVNGLVQLLRGPWSFPRSAPTRSSRRLETDPAFVKTARFREACWHCHYAHDAEIAAARRAGRFEKTSLYRYPPASVLGIAFSGTGSTRVESVATGSPAARAGLRPGDRLVSVDGAKVSCETDVRHVLDRVPERPAGTLELAWERARAARSARVELPDGWRVYDISDRPSQGAIPPILGIWEERVSDSERRTLGIPAGGIGLRVSFLFPGAKWAGTRGDLRLGDVIVAVDGDRLSDWSPRRFHTWLRMNRQVGETARFTVLRSGREVEVALPLVDPGPLEETP